MEKLQEKEIEDIRALVVEIMERNGVQFVDGQEEEAFVDSIQFITSMVDIEDTFGIEVPEDYMAMEGINSLEEIVNMIIEIKSK